ncbi:DUF1275 family protein [Streptomyces viridosporus]|uniref:DUF1275 family protein n=1 Tax=Streptomyces viridosporus TaxID=67581 RepID=UPI003F65F234
MLGLAAVGVATPGARALMASPLALAMGVQAATARHLAVRDVTTVVVTSTLTGLAADSRLGAARPQGTRRRTAAVALIITGALTGAALCRVHEGLAAAAALVALAVSGLGHASAHFADRAAADRPAMSPKSGSPPEPSGAGAGGSTTRAAGPLLVRHQRKGLL